MQLALHFLGAKRVVIIFWVFKASTEASTKSPHEERLTHDRKRSRFMLLSALA